MPTRAGETEADEPRTTYRTSAEPAAQSFVKGTEGADAFLRFSFGARSERGATPSGADWTLVLHASNVKPREAVEKVIDSNQWFRGGVSLGLVLTDATPEVV